MVIMVRFFIICFLISSVPLFALPGLKEETEKVEQPALRSSREENNDANNERRNDTVTFKEEALTEVPEQPDQDDPMGISNQSKNNGVSRESEPSFPAAKITSSAGLAEAPQGTFQGAKLQAIPNETHYRLIDNNNETVKQRETCSLDQGETHQSLKSKEWKITTEFPITDLNSNPIAKTSNTPNTDVSSVLKLVGKNDNRVDLIDKKRDAYKKELEKLEKSEAFSSADRDRIFVLKALIPVLQKASDYQKEMITHLEKTAAKWSTKTAAVSESLDALFKMNEAPNKVEKVAMQLENDGYQLALTQNRLLALITVRDQIERRALEPIFARDLEIVVAECTQLQKIITFQKNLISQKVTYATSLRPPYETLDVVTQSVIQQNKKNCIKEEIAVEETTAQMLLIRSPNIERQIVLNEIAEEIEKPEPNKQVIAWFREAINFYQQAIETNNLGQVEESIYLRNAGEDLYQTAKEAQKLEPNKQVITCYREALYLFQQAAIAKFSQNLKAQYLGTAANFLFDAALETQKPQSNKRVIVWYREAADLMQQAVAAIDLVQVVEANNLERAGTYLSRAALEAQKLEPNEQVIALYREAADLIQQAVAAINLGQENKALCLRSASSNLLHAAEEANEPEPNERVIAWYREGVDLMQQAVAAIDLGQDRKAIYLYNAGLGLYEAALEAQSREPDQQVINDNLREAAKNKKCADSIFNSSCIIS